MGENFLLALILWRQQAHHSSRSFEKQLAYDFITAYLLFYFGLLQSTTLEGQLFLRKPFV